LSVFVDTSAWYALASVSDQDHAAAEQIYAGLIERNEPLVTSSYVLAESMGLIQRRLGWKALELYAAAMRTMDVVWIDEGLHREAETILFARRRGISIVDAAAFALMKSLGIESAFAFDDDFEREGFAVLRPQEGS
jgi:predicted nucleic acid-binding protein